jgi:hypothetical protein
MPEQHQPSRLTLPLDCHLWKKQNLTHSDLACLEEVERYIDDSRLIRSLRRCKECGHLYLYQLIEVIDYALGHDSQYRTYLPVDSGEDVPDLMKSRTKSIGEFAPSLHSDWPKGFSEPEVFWVR